MRLNAFRLLALVAVGAIPSMALPLDRSSVALAARDFLAPGLAEELAVAKRSEEVEEAGALYPLPLPPGKTSKDMAKPKTPNYMKPTVSSKNKQTTKKGKRSDEVEEAGALYPLPLPPGKTSKDMAKPKTPNYMKPTVSSKNKQTTKKGKRSEEVDEAGALYPLPLPPGKTSKDMAKPKTPNYMKPTVSSKNKQTNKKGKREAGDEAAPELAARDPKRKPSPATRNPRGRPSKAISMIEPWFNAKLPEDPSHIV